MAEDATETLRVTYLELRRTPDPATPPLPPTSPAPPTRSTGERIAPEQLTVDEYLAIYRSVGAPLQWDQRLRMLREELALLLRSTSHIVYILRDESRAALGLCEFDRSGFPSIELKNFGLLPAAQGRGLGPWLLATALHREWQTHARRIWLHTDTWDHPAALHVYRKAGFEVYAVADEPAASL